MKNLSRLSFAVAILVTLASAEAGIISVKFDHLGASDTISITAPKPMSSAPTGLLVLDKQSGDPLWHNGPLLAFCGQIEQDASYRYRDYTVEPVDAALDPAQADALSELWGRYFDDAWVTKNETNNLQAAAFQMAVWEIICDGQSNADFDHGNFIASTDCVTTDLAGTWLTSLDGTGPQADLRCLTNDTRQNFLVEVPEPMTLLMVASAVPCLLLRRRVLD